MQRVKEAHLAPQPILCIPSIEITNDENLLWEILYQELQSNHPPQQLATLHIIIEAIQHQRQEAAGDKDEHGECPVRKGEHPMMLAIVALAEVLPGGLEATLLLLVNLVKVIDPGVDYVNEDFSLAGRLPSDADRAAPLSSVTISSVAW